MPARPTLSSWSDIDIRIVTDNRGAVTIIDLPGNILVGPVPMGDREQVQLLVDWVRDYLLDSAAQPRE